jgi:dolichol-phosphate mannosyltransferase
VLFGYYSIPLKFIVGLGFYISLASFLLGMMFLFKKIFFNVEVEGWTSLMVSLMFSSGVITFSLGLIGKYLLHLITLLNDKPGYSIAETVG